MSRSYFKNPKKSKGLTTFLELNRIKEIYPNVIVKKITDKDLSVVLTVKPTPINDNYNLKINYSKRGAGSVDVFVIDKKLEIADNRKTLPHVYNTRLQKLCLFTPKKREWNLKMPLIESIIPWALEWLDFYEHWLVNGEWLGGGHDEYAIKK